MNYVYFFLDSPNLRKPIYKYRRKLSLDGDGSFRAKRGLETIITVSN
jgi:hypothetical protein